ncbi:cryptochrome/photolyase family protein [Rickettsia endosymbiont of Halotydeus destructor]|uniref:cryptochrome/photolyase family protein n=1 Tax=Rickettsia endosymbiont of Halotydeus destructor TaxID=2996754 RepID=UPI003BAF3A23
MSKLSIIWLRRNLRLQDNKSFAAALRNSEKILPIFIFDTTILKRFINSGDRRLSFLASTLYQLHNKLQELKGELLVFYGDPLLIIPKLAEALDVKAIYADEDYEPDNIKRDEEIKKQLGENRKLELFCDHLLIKPDRILTKDNQPYKVYTPYMQSFRKYLADHNAFPGNTHNKLLTAYNYNLDDKLASFADIDLPRLNLTQGPKGILNQIGYNYKKDDLWRAENAENVLNKFIRTKINNYKTNRDFLHLDGTSTISPYLRFGLISIRQCYRKAFELTSNLGVITWINELIWREFYANILYHFPYSVKDEFLEKYRRKIPWNKDAEIFYKFTEGKTGYPIIDAAVRQLLQDGWMHNRARMIVASFLTKNLLIDWRMGEEFFAQYLMDYELASNVGGWQWAASCGTDAQPYFRIFNPYTQGKNFNPNAEYVKKYLPELEDVPANIIHNINFTKIYPDYTKPIVDYKLSRVRALAVFKKI